MSYEGYIEYLCPKGHAWAHDVYSEPENGHVCKRCGASATWQHDVDQTNGMEIDNPSTFSAGVACIGFEEDWLVDHYGNRYAEKIALWGLHLVQTGSLVDRIDELLAECDALQVELETELAQAQTIEEIKQVAAKYMGKKGLISTKIAQAFTMLHN